MGILLSLCCFTWLVPTSPDSLILTTPYAFSAKSRIETPLLNPSLNADQSDPWMGRDKILHASFSALWMLSSQYILVNKGGISEMRALPLSAGGTLTLGIGKEWYDKHYGNSRFFSIRDVAADLLGIGIATLIILI